MKIGLFGIGLNTYWGQFEGLLDRLEGYRREIADRLGAMGVEVTDAGMVDDPTKADAAAALLYIVHLNSDGTIEDKYAQGVFPEAIDVNGDHVLSVADAAAILTLAVRGSL